MAFIESIENRQLAVDSFDQIFLSPIILPLIVGDAEGSGWDGRGEGESVCARRGSMCFSDITVKQPPIVTALILRLTWHTFSMM